MFTARSDELSFILRAHVIEGDNQLPTGSPLVHAFVCTCMSECARASVHEHVHTRTCTHTRHCYWWIMILHLLIMMPVHPKRCSLNLPT